MHVTEWAQTFGQAAGEHPDPAVANGVVGPGTNACYLSAGASPDAPKSNQLLRLDMKFSHKSSKFIGAVVTQHPVDIIEPNPVDEDVLRAVEAYNSVSHWVLGKSDPTEIGRRALCILTCAQREKLPDRGIFRAVENNHAEQLIKSALIAILSILVDPKDLACTGRKVAFAFSSIRKEILGARTLCEIGRMLGCKKQAVSQSQARFGKTVRKKFPSRSDRGKPVGKPRAWAVG